MPWTELRVLIVDTGRVWWRLPVIMGVYLLGWLGSEVTLRVATIAGDISAWLALACSPSVLSARSPPQS